MHVDVVSVLISQDAAHYSKMSPPCAAGDHSSHPWHQVHPNSQTCDSNCSAFCQSPHWLSSICCLPCHPQPCLPPHRIYFLPHWHRKRPVIRWSRASPSCPYSGSTVGSSETRDSTRKACSTNLSKSCSHKCQESSYGSQLHMKSCFDLGRCAKQS